MAMRRPETNWQAMSSCRSFARVAGSNPVDRFVPRMVIAGNEGYPMAGLAPVPE
jgi:hypothetical protein